MGKGELSFFTILADPEHRQFIWVARPLANHIGSKIKIFGDFQVEIAAFSLVVGHMWSSCLGHSSTLLLFERR